MPKETYIKEISKTIRPTVMECIHVQMELDTKETGLMMHKLVKVKRTGQMAPATKAITRMA